MRQFAFGDVPLIKHSRSQFDLSHGIKTSGNLGTLYPFEVQEVYAGDTFKIQTSVVTRLTSQYIRPIMDNLFIDVYHFFVPSRLLYDNFEKIFGEATPNAYTAPVDYSAPVTSGPVPEKTVGEYLGLPTAVNLEAINVLPFRAFAKIYDDWFRDENNVLPMLVQTGETNSNEVFNTDAWGPNNYFGAPPKVSKFHDLFTSCLPAPQKGNAVSIPLGATASIEQNRDVINSNKLFVNTDGSTHIMNNVLKFGGVSAVPSSGLPGGFLGISSIPGTGNPSNSNRNVRAVYGTEPSGTFDNIDKSNLVVPSDEITSKFMVDLSSATATTVNDLRFAFQYQKLLERSARSGSRYTEYLQSAFGVTNSDARLQRSEFLGGKRTPLSVVQVTQTTGSDDVISPLAQVGALGHSASKRAASAVKSFTENGFIIGVYCIRQFHTYQQGVERFWKRSSRTSYYDPIFATIGEQPVMTTELYAGAPSDQVFGYQEAWYDLRSRPNRVSGQMRSNARGSLDFWHLADNYTNAPVLSQAFIEETPVYLDRAIRVSSDAQDQFILDFWEKSIAYRVVPSYSVPSLIDHH